MTRETVNSELEGKTKREILSQTGEKKKKSQKEGKPKQKKTREDHESPFPATPRESSSEGSDPLYLQLLKVAREGRPLILQLLGPPPEGVLDPGLLLDEFLGVLELATEGRERVLGRERRSERERKRRWPRGGCEGGRVCMYTLSGLRFRPRLALF